MSNLTGIYHKVSHAHGTSRRWKREAFSDKRHVDDSERMNEVNNGLALEYEVREKIDRQQIDGDLGISLRTPGVSGSEGDHREGRPDEEMRRSAQIVRRAHRCVLVVARCRREIVRGWITRVDSP